jgi:predicted acylesterase/phospholipase RssA
MMAIKNIAIACQGGGSHAAYAAGALPALLPQFSNLEIAQSSEAERRKLKDGADEKLLHLTGISGTSGGAISALLAWYSFLTGGENAVRPTLERFWDANCAQRPGEHLVNELGQWWGSMLPLDLKLSPYLSPLQEIEGFAAGMWPLMAACWPPLGNWIRGPYFQLRETVAPHVDFKLVAAIGDFCSIPLDIKRWQACDLEARMFNPAAPQYDRIRRTQQAIEAGIRSKLGAVRRIRDGIARSDIPEDTLLCTAFASWVEPNLAFDPVSLEKLSQAVTFVSYSIPQLLIGAVDIDSGAFVAFSSERSPQDAGITLDAVVASASLPWVFKAQELDGTDAETHEPRKMYCWDGLFSQNPPIKDFISNLADRTKKPHGLWILQINQDRFDFSKRVADARGSARSGGELWHRRDTLSGNLSLNQEVAFIKAFNQRMDDPGQRFLPDDKPIEVARIVLDGEAVETAAAKELGLFSKFDRDPVLEQALLAHGRKQALSFLSLRSSADRLCDELAHALEEMGARPGPRMEKASGWLPGGRRIFGGLLAPDVMTIDRVRGSGPVGVAQATLQWHVSDAVVDGCNVRIRGSTRLLADGADWHLGETRLLDIEQKTVEARQPSLQRPEAKSAPYRPSPLTGERDQVGRGRGVPQ